MISPERGSLDLEFGCGECPFPTRGAAEFGFKPLKSARNNSVGFVNGEAGHHKRRKALHIVLTSVRSDIVYRDNKNRRAV
jgi:hypothetical protein